MPYERCIFYTVVLAVVALDRPTLKSKVGGAVAGTAGTTDLQAAVHDSPHDILATPCARLLSLLPPAGRGLARHAFFNNAPLTNLQTVRSFCCPPAPARSSTRPRCCRSFPPPFAML